MLLNEKGKWGGNLGRRINKGVEFPALKPGREAKQLPEYSSLKFRMDH